MQEIPGYIYHLSYVGIFIWFAFLEQITPVPEEVSLISIGYISMHDTLNPFIAAAVAVAGLLTADNIIFYLSLKGNKLIDKLTGKASKKLVEKMKESLKQNATKTLIVMALLPKIRFLSPVLSAAASIKWKLFFYINSVVTVVYVIVYMLIGILFQKQLQYIFHELELWQHVIFVLAMLIIAILLFKRIKKMLNAD